MYATIGKVGTLTCRAIITPNLPFQMCLRSAQEAWAVFAGDACQYSAARQYQDHQQACMESFQRFLGREGPRHPAEAPLLPAVLSGAPVKAPFSGSLTQQYLELTAGGQSSVVAASELARPQPRTAPVPLEGLYTKVSTYSLSQCGGPLDLELSEAALSIIS